MTGSFQPSLVHRMQAAVEGDDIRAAAVVMLRYHQLVPVAQRQARIEDLHDRDAALASQPCRQRRLPTTAQRQARRGPGQRAGEVGAEGRGRAGESSRRQPTREARGLQDDLEGPELAITDSNILEPINLGSSELVTINQLVDIVEQIAGITVKRRYKLDAPKGVNVRNSDNTKIRQYLGWEPSVTLRDGLEQTYRWIHDEIQAAKPAGAAA